MNLEVKDIPAKILPYLQKLKKYIPIFIMILVVILYSFLILKIGQLSQGQPDEIAILEKLNTVQRPTIDKDAVDKIKQLRSENIEVETLFTDVRNNPFLECTDAALRDPRSPCYLSGL